MSPPERFHFKINWKITVFALMLLPVLVSLGLWQFDRAEEKRTILDNRRAQQAQPPVAFAADQLDEQLGRRVIAGGRFDRQRYWLLENKIFNGRLGVQVIAPLQLDNDQWLAVNLGWVAASGDRSQLPPVTIPAGPVSVHGTLSGLSDSPLIDESDNHRSHWPHRILELDAEQMSSQLGETVYPVVLLSDPDSPGAQQVYWQPVNMSPSRHRGYAVQWLTMAVALIILWLFANTNLAACIRRRHQD